mmetsp:Transcript_37427/g.87650  ORF Transcript_37427/g.87650 Transcript_37427/m.87650 type:complete len:235 (+) Transcript_37427:993-1697(+)
MKSHRPRFAGLHYPSVASSLLTSSQIMMALPACRAVGPQCGHVWRTSSTMRLRSSCSRKMRDSGVGDVRTTPQALTSIGSTTATAEAVATRRAMSTAPVADSIDPREPEAKIRVELHLPLLYRHHHSSNSTIPIGIQMMFWKPRYGALRTRIIVAIATEVISTPAEEKEKETTLRRTTPRWQIKWVDLAEVRSPLGAWECLCLPCHCGASPSQGPSQQLRGVHLQCVGTASCLQ